MTDAQTIAALKAKVAELERERKEYYEWRQQDADRATHLRSEIGQLKRELGIHRAAHVKTYDRAVIAERERNEAQSDAALFKAGMDTNLAAADAAERDKARAEAAHECGNAVTAEKQRDEARKVAFEWQSVCARVDADRNALEAQRDALAAALRAFGREHVTQRSMAEGVSCDCALCAQARAALAAVGGET